MSHSFYYNLKQRISDNLWQACRFAKCRQMGMTHTTLETQPFPSSTNTSSCTSSVVKNSPSPYLSVKNSTLSLSPIMEESGGYSNDIYDYDVNLSQPLQTEDQGQLKHKYVNISIIFQ